MDSYSSEELSEKVTVWVTQDYISVAFYCFYGYYYLITLPEETRTIWPQKWRTGKALFVILRYMPIAAIAATMLTDMRVYLVITPEICRCLALSIEVAYRLHSYASEVTLLLCLYALLGARQRYLLLLIGLYLGSSIGILVPQIKYIRESTQAVPNDQFSQELGYACSWKPLSQGIIAEIKAVLYFSLAKACCLSGFVILVIYVRYRSQTGTLFTVLRRDGGIHLLSLIAARLIAKITDFLNPTSPLLETCLARFQDAVIPILACRLLLNIHCMEDPGVQSIVSSILFQPAGEIGDPGMTSEMATNPSERAIYTSVGG
ncbi:hypothetical protein DFP72DRAFT_926397 [Ephemerocybe angulata]|uniref:DUF6533 domain-containing protein n=1 Tax=Ephemerocybe angulata TaxID=980116 RepID=A0A8H6HFC5_9AGAR|nr:hypothetical protein DFP72DRAFT_926397 [Tulosesus angulatus]